MKFIISFGKLNTFSLNARPVTNLEYYHSLLSKMKAENIPMADYQRALDDPKGTSFIGTLNRVKTEFADGGSVAFA